MSSLLTAEVKQALRLRPGVNVVVAVGNSWRSDDGAGPYIADRLADCPGLYVFDAETNPENFVQRIIALHPAYLLFIDAADFGGAPGEARMIEKEEIPAYTLSTHMFPLSAICELIAQSVPAEIRVLGIQIADCAFGEGLSTAVEKTAEAVVCELKNSEPGKGGEING